METIGFLELNSIAKGIETADIVLKTAAVDLFFSDCVRPPEAYGGSVMTASKVLGANPLSTFSASP